jgi:hypothetical protein
MLWSSGDFVSVDSIKSHVESAQRSVRSFASVAKICPWKHSVPMIGVRQMQLANSVVFLPRMADKLRHSGSDTLEPPKWLSQDGKLPALKRFSGPPSGVIARGFRLFKYHIMRQ